MNKFIESVLLRKEAGGKHALRIAKSFADPFTYESRADAVRAATAAYYKELANKLHVRAVKTPGYFTGSPEALLRKRKAAIAQKLADRASMTRELAWQADRSRHLARHARKDSWVAPTTESAEALSRSAKRARAQARQDDLDNLRGGGLSLRTIEQIAPESSKYFDRVKNWGAMNFVGHKGKKLRRRGGFASLQDDIGDDFDIINPWK